MTAIVTTPFRVVNAQNFKEDVISDIEIDEGLKDDLINLLNEKTSGKVSILK